jgi:hypothetical protein
MLPKSQQCAYVRYDKGSKAVKFYNVATRNILTSRNYRFLVPSNASPPEEIAVDPQSNQGEQQTPACEGEPEDSTCGATLSNLKKQPAESDIDPRDLWKTRGKWIDYKELVDSGKIIEYKEMIKPFLDEAEAGIVKIVKEKAYAIVPTDDDCHSLRDA